MKEGEGREVGEATFPRIERPALGGRCAGKIVKCDFFRPHDGLWFAESARTGKIG